MKNEKAKQAEIKHSVNSRKVYKISIKNASFFVFFFVPSFRVLFLYFCFCLTLTKYVDRSRDLSPERQGPMAKARGQANEPAPAKTTAGGREKRRQTSNGCPLDSSALPLLSLNLSHSVSCWDRNTHANPRTLSHIIIYEPTTNIYAKA